MRALARLDPRVARRSPLILPIIAITAAAAVALATAAVAQAGVWSAATQQDQFTASDGAASDLFGASVAVSGDTAVVGAYLDGVPVDAAITGLVGFRTGRSGGSANLISAMTAIRRATGVLDVSIDPPRSAGEMTIYQFTVTYTDSEGKISRGVVIVRRGGERE
ncbi:MAG: hypothetical protein FJ312_09180 [SAR202 cluster bacterium]|nr:hypothetical protein [SAR202 cluster bacterium]